MKLKMTNIAKKKRIRPSGEQKRELVVRYEQSLHRIKFLKKTGLTKQKINQFRTDIKYGKNDVENKKFIQRIRTESQYKWNKKLEKKMKKKKNLTKPKLPSLNIK